MIVLLTLLIGLTALCGQVIVYDSLLFLKNTKGAFRGILEHPTNVFPDLYEHDTLYGATKP